MNETTYNVTRFACRCGRFLSDAAIRHTDYRDGSRYYGIRSEVEWDCGRCGMVKGEEWEPQIVVTGTRVLPTADDEPSRVQAIEAAEDHADQTAFDAWRERGL